jgi:hypothetical protein
MQTVSQGPAPAVPAQPPQPGQPGQPGTTVIETPVGRFVLPGEVTAAARYEASKAKREVIRDLLERARNRRAETAQQLRSDAAGIDRAGLEKRIADLDLRIGDLEKQQIEAEGEMVLAASIPGAMEEDARDFGGGPARNGPPDVVFIVVPILLVLFGVFPLALAWSRRIWKRTGAAAAAIPHALLERFGRLEQNVDAMAIEVERISEGQRFMTKLFSEQGGRAQLHQAADPVEMGLTSSVPRP